MKRTIFAILLLGVAVCFPALLSHSQTTGLVAHEWGTFTSFQSADGQLQSWRPLETSKLPGFVADTLHPGFDRTVTGPTPIGKGAAVTLQRMETPVIYFYSSTPATVDVTVKFPKGSITEWYPDASQFGPATIKPDTDLPSPGDLVSTESMIRWRGVDVLPTAKSAPDAAQPELPTDSSGSHYFAARETDANVLRMPQMPGFISSPEFEKFLFYRGVGNFSTPLTVTMPTADEVVLANTGTEPLKHLFVLAVKDGAGRQVYVEELPAGATKSVPIAAAKSLPLKDLSEKIASDMAAALVKTGLFPREATAMVNTWRDSWFQEPGVRVLYTLPRSWTDETLNLQITPAPDNIIRTMVGRAEVLPPDVEANLVTLFNQAKHGDKAASDQARQVLAGLGRFAYPAFNLALPKVNPQADEGVALADLLTLK